MTVDVIKTPKRKRPASKRHEASRRKTKGRKTIPHVVNDTYASTEWRVVLRINRANELTDDERFRIVNWLRGKINELGDDAFGRNLAPTYHARLVV